MKRIVFFVIFILLTSIIIAQNSKVANKYVIQKYDSCDIIVIGETHRIKSELEFVSNIIPELYKHNVKTFAFEFLAYKAQMQIDSLMQCNYFDTTLLKAIISYKPRWFLKDYEKILYVLWGINQNQKDLTVLGINSAEKDIYIEDQDSVMASIILSNYNEANNKKKVFVLCGRNHSFTSFYQRKTNGEIIKRLGNYIYEKYPNKIINLTFIPMLVKLSDTTFCKYNINIHRSQNIGIDFKGQYFDEEISDVSLKNTPQHKLSDIFVGSILLKDSTFNISPIDKEINRYNNLFTINNTIKRLYY
jgi:hypothetical protein